MTKLTVPIAGIMMIFTLFTSCKVHKKYKSPERTSTVKVNTTGQFKQLRTEIDAWLGVPYKYGGNDKSGVDCSGLTCAMYKSVYGKTIPRTSKEQYAMCRKITLNEMVEGDLVFFKIESAEVTHVGVYLQNQQFIHASVAKGVVISDLQNPYYKQYFVGAGRY